MTNQNVVTPSEIKLCINTLIAMLPGGGGYLSLPHQNFMKTTTLEDAKVSAWIDSMRAASPTRAKSSENREKSSWNVSITKTRPFFFEIIGFFLNVVLTDLCMFLICLQLYHPSALNLFDSIVNKSKGKQLVIFLDYDGTLSPIVTDPEKAFMSRKVNFPFLP